MLLADWGRACSGASVATFRFFTKLWAVIQPLFCWQDTRPDFKKPWSTLRSWSSV